MSSASVPFEATDRPTQREPTAVASGVHTVADVVSRNRHRAGRETHFAPLANNARFILCSVRYGVTKCSRLFATPAQSRQLITFR